MSGSLWMTFCSTAGC